MNTKRRTSIFLVITLFGSSLIGAWFANLDPLWAAETNGSLVVPTEENLQLTTVNNLTVSTPLTDTVKVSAGAFHTCALSKTGGVKCWGWNMYGQLGNGVHDSYGTPRDVIGLSSGVGAVSAGGYHTCALTTAGGVQCWGRNSRGQLGNGSTEQSDIPVDVIGLSSGVYAIATGATHACVAMKTGGVKCWGDNRYGQLGVGDSGYSSTPIDVDGLLGGASAISVGDRHSCALIGSSRVNCWGSNSAGQLGDGRISDRSTAVTVVGIGDGIRSIRTGGTFSCALSVFDSLSCWGSNTYGQLGNGSRLDSKIPVGVNGLSGNIRLVTMGEYHMCALTTADGVKCWGVNAIGELGIGNTNDSLTPVAVPGLDSSIIDISAGQSHTCAVTSASQIKCWGSNSVGQLGNGTTASQNRPIDVPNLSSEASAIAVGGVHSCALTTSGTVKCWGYGGYGQLGNENVGNRSTPFPVSGLDNNITALTTGAYHACALTSFGAVQCWGWNGSGQLGTGDRSNRNIPSAVMGLYRTSVTVGAGNDHTCALTSVGGIKCWGSNSAGQLGIGNHNSYRTPVDVKGLGSGVRALDVGAYHSCALTDGNGVKCWGWNDSGQLGNGSTLSSTTPIDVSSLISGVSAIALGGYHTCALMNAGGVKCWGWNGEGQLGNGTTERSLTPVDVIGLESGVAALSLGNYQSCALTTAGGVKCWGWNFYGQLGNGNNISSTIPVDVVGLSSGVRQISTRNAHSCAVMTTGNVKCWGWNGNGQLGDGTAWETSPVDVVVPIYDHFVFLPLVAR